MFGVPVDDAEFELRMPSSDWLSKFWGETPPAERWRKDYQPYVAAHLVALIEKAERLGVKAVRGTTLDLFREATGTNDLIILFAHWKGFEVIVDDLARPNERAVYAERAAGSHTPLARSLQRELASRDDRTVREILAGAVYGNGLEPEKLEAGIDRIYESELTARTRRRDELDALFKGLLRPGNRLELFDGLHCSEAVESSIAPEFRGILDLTVCTSEVLGDYIGSRRRAAVRTVQFPEVQDFGWASLCVEIALQMHLVDGIPYLEARMHAMNILATALKGLED